MAGEGEELGLLGGGGEEVELAPGAEDQIVEVEEETPGGDDGGGAGDGGGEGDEDLTGGGSRAIVKLEPTAIRKALREISTTNPEFAKKFPTLEKAVTTALFKSGQIEKFGGVQAVAEAIAAIELHGGVDAIADMAAEVEAGRQLEAGFKQGDPKVIDGWAKDYPGGFKKLIVPAIDKLEAIDKTHFEAVASYVLEKLFATYGVNNAIAALGEAISGDKKDDAVKNFNLLAKFIVASKDLAKNARIGNADADAELEEERTNLAKDKRNMVYSSARMDVNPKIMFEVNRLLRQILPAGTKVKVEQANRLRAEINKEARIAMNADDDFSATFESILAKGDKDRLGKFILQRAQKHLPKVVRRLVNEFGLTRGGKTNNAGGGGSGTRRAAAGGGGGSTVQNGRPKTGDIDFQHTDKAVWISSISAGHSTGPIFLKNGKTAKW